jgi:hypothetical protein
MRQINHPTQPKILKILSFNMFNVFIAYISNKKANEMHKTFTN